MGACSRESGAQESGVLLKQDIVPAGCVQMSVLNQFTLFLSLSLSLSLSHTHTHTHSLSHTCQHSHYAVLLSLGGREGCLIGVTTL